jgi:uncharacterized protein YbaP (TraB family)
MRQRHIAIFCVALVMLLSWAGYAQAAEVLDEVVVTGERPGPQLWRVSKGEHTLWLLGTPDVLPAKMRWHSPALEAALSKAEQVLTGPSISVHGGPFALLRLYRQWRRVQESTDHAKLSEVLPADTYARFERLRQRYAARDRRIVELRPMLAADRLFDRAIEASGLTADTVIEDTVIKLAKKRRINIHHLEITIDDPSALLTEIGASTRDSEIKCLTATIQRLESDVGAMTQRANAWAIGDIQAISALTYPDNRAACADIFTNSPHFAALFARRESDWMFAAVSALDAHANSLALRPIRHLLDPNGVLKTFRDRGYRVDTP